MPSDYWENWAEESGVDWDEVSAIHIFRGDDAWSVAVETSDGEYIESPTLLDDMDAEDLIWDDLYWFAQEYDIEFDKEISYSED